LKRFFSRAVGRLLDGVFPPKCRVCSTFLGHATSATLLTAPPGPDLAFSETMRDHLCQKCSDNFIPVTTPYCTCCGDMFSGRQGSSHLCGKCILAPKPFRKARSAGLYDGSLGILIQQLKYQGKPELAKPLGRLLFSAFLRHWQVNTLDLILPVPLHGRRLRQRGFNQSLLLLKYWQRWLTAMGTQDIPPIVDRSLLSRHRATSPQTGLGRTARKANVKNAFSILKKAGIIGKRVLLVDDVYTTGTTVDACAQILTAAGARHVDVLTLAKTESDSR